MRHEVAKISYVITHGDCLGRLWPVKIFKRLEKHLSGVTLTELITSWSNRMNGGTPEVLSALCFCDSVVFCNLL